MEVPLRLINIQLRTVLAVGGVGGLAVGLALQNLIQNLISGTPGLGFSRFHLANPRLCEKQGVRFRGLHGAGFAVNATGGNSFGG